MKTSLRLMISLVLLGLLPLVKAGEVEDLKMEIARILPVGTHQDRVRQFLMVRKFKLSEQPKEKTLTGRLVRGGFLKGETIVEVVFEFDAGGLIKDVRYSGPNPGK